MKNGPIEIGDLFIYTLDGDEYISDIVIAIPDPLVKDVTVLSLTHDLKLKVMTLDEVPNSMYIEHVKSDRS